MRYRLTITTLDGTYKGDIDIYRTFRAGLRANDVGTWQLTAPATTSNLELLTAGHRLRMVTTVDTGSEPEFAMGGPVVRVRRRVAGGEDSLDVYGATDDIWLLRRRTHPDPSTADTVPSATPHTWTEVDVRTGRRSTIMRALVDDNLGPSAITGRQVPGIALGDDPLAGIANAELRGTMSDTVLATLQVGALPDGLFFGIRDLTFDVWESSTVPGKPLSLANDTLSELTIDLGSPDANFVYVAGEGEDDERTWAVTADNESRTVWGRAEGFRDAGDATSADALQAAGLDELARSNPIVPIEVVLNHAAPATPVFGRDFTFGSVLKVARAGVPVPDGLTVRSADFDFGVDGQKVTVRPTPRSVLSTQLVRRLLNAERRLSILAV